MWTYLRRFHSDEDSAIAVMFAVFLFVLVGFAALAIDMGYSFATRTDLQVMADWGALIIFGIFIGALLLVALSKVLWDQLSNMHPKNGERSRIYRYR